MTIELRSLAVDEWRELARERESAGEAVPDAATSERLQEVFGAALSIEAAVRTILADVRARGDAAVREWTARADGARVESLRVPTGAAADAERALEPRLRNALLAAAERIRGFHECQVADLSARGTSSVQLRPEPLTRVGCYTPGGRAAYPSTVLMTVIPAQVAGVGAIALASPPDDEGRVHPLVLASAHLVGVDEVYAIGGAQAVGALAFGTQTIARVDKVVGPGNAFVTAAKRMIFGAVGIDQLAGPSEIVVVASEGAEAELIAADLVSQLEHDTLAWAACFTDNPTLASALVEQFAAQAERAQRSGIVGSAAGSHAAVVTCESLEVALRLAEEFAPEHLSLQGPAAELLRDRVRSAGAVFCGAFSPVSIGDYVAGPNHTLPTQGAARHRGPLSVLDFVRWPSVTQLSESEFEALAPIACILAEAEGLHGHAAAIRVRMAHADSSA